MISIENEERPWRRFYVLTVIISQGVKHRNENKASEKVVFIEVHTGTYFEEHDIVRIEDYYNRA